MKTSKKQVSLADLISKVITETKQVFISVITIFVAGKRNAGT